MLSDEIVSCCKDPDELVLFHDVEVNGHIREGSIHWKLVRVFQDRSLLQGRHLHGLLAGVLEDLFPDFRSTLPEPKPR